MEDNFKVGDVVVLKSGSKHMTITGRQHDGAGRAVYECSCFIDAGFSSENQTQMLRRFIFPPEALKKVNENATGPILG